MQALENLSRSNEVTLGWVCGHHAIPANEADKSAKEGTNGAHFDQSVGIPSVVGTAVIRNYLKQEHLNRRQSKTLMSEPLPGRKNRRFKQ